MLPSTLHKQDKVVYQVEYRPWIPKLDGILRLTDIEEKSLEISIYGAGALGMAIAMEVALRDPRVRIRPYAQRRLFHSVRLEAPAAGLDGTRCITCQHLDDFARNLGHPDEGKGQSASPIIVVTPPPQFMDAATRAVLDALASSATARHTTVYLLGNGLITDATVALIKAAEHAPAPAESLRTRWIRGLAIAGFQSTWVEPQRRLHVIHTSGHAILLGSYGKGAVETDFPEGPLFPGPLFVPQAVDNVRAFELRKFFVNAVLGWALGASGEPNGSLSKRLDPGTANTLAAEFAQLFPEAGPSQHLSGLLWQTAEETAENLNSVGRAWRDGDPRLAYYFRDTILQAVASRKAGEAVSCQALCKLLKT